MDNASPRSPDVMYRSKPPPFQYNFHAGHSSALHVALIRNLVVVCGPAGCGKSTIGEYLAKEKGWLFLEGDDYHPQANRDKMHAGIPLTDDDRAGWLETLAATCIITLATNTIVIVSCSALKQKYRQVFRSAIANANFANLSINTTLCPATCTTTRKLSLSSTPNRKFSFTSPRKLSLTSAIATTTTCTRRKLSLAKTTFPSIKTKPETIKLSFIFLSMSLPKALHLVRARALSTGHFMPATLVSSQFDILELPSEGEKDAKIFDADLGVGEVMRGCLGMLEGLVENERGWGDVGGKGRGEVG
ncbi:carbohydrate kinase [Acephala macrosclerotiorum]|nr:carbohydrate kinase [Acephala macrosclerotiorum]